MKQNAPVLAELFISEGEEDAGWRCATMAVSPEIRQVGVALLPGERESLFQPLIF